MSAAARRWPQRAQTSPPRRPGSDLDLLADGPLTLAWAANGICAAHDLVAAVTPWAWASDALRARAVRDAIVLS